MEITSSALTGALRVGIQVIVGRKRPVIEIYDEVRNEFSPPTKFDLTDSAGKVVRVDEHRLQRVFIGLTLINIGAERAERLSFEVSGDFRQDFRGTELPEIFSVEFNQVAPGQSIFLLNIDQYDLLKYVDDPKGNPSVKVPDGVKSEVLTVVMHYDGPDTFSNRILRLWRRWKGLKQFSTTFVFNPKTYCGDLPPPRYHN